VHTRNRGNQPAAQAAAQQRGGCPEPGTHLQAVLHRLAHPQQGTARARVGFPSSFLPLDNPASSALTQDLAGWRPTRPD
jgi:hypothetical protein